MPILIDLDNSKNSTVRLRTRELFRYVFSFIQSPNLLTNFFHLNSLRCVLPLSEKDVRGETENFWLFPTFLKMMANVNKNLKNSSIN